MTLSDEILATTDKTLLALAGRGFLLCLKMYNNWSKLKIFRFFSRLVGEGLVYFQCKVPQIMEAIGLSFDNLYFVIDPFDLSSVDREITVVDNTIAVPIQHAGEVD